MLMDLIDGCKISHLGVHCPGQFFFEVALPRAIEFDFFFETFLSPLGCVWVIIW